MDKQNNKWCEEIYNPRHGQNVHEFELETVCESQIILKKKKYLKGLRCNKGKFLDKPKMSGTGIEIIKSTTPKLCREILTELTKSLMFDFSEDAVLMVLASELYDEADYIRSYDEFLEFVKSNIKPGWKLNPNEKVVNAIIKGLNRCNGECPCQNNSINKVCPCSNYREHDR